MRRDPALPARGVLTRALPLTAILFGIASMPYMYGFLSSPADRVFTGLMFDVPDHAQYWSWVTASQASFFISNTMTPEPNAPIFINPMMWLLARIQLLASLSFPALLQVWRLLATVAVVPAVVAFVRVFVIDPRRRPVALLIALLGSGLGWTLLLVKKLTHSAELPWPHDVYTVEPNTFWALLSYPYLSLAHALMLGTFIGVWLAWRERRALGYAVAAGSAAALSGSHAYDLITVYVVLGAFVLVEWLHARRFPTRLAGVLVLIGAASGPTALYYQQLTAHDPLWRALLAQYSNAGVWTPPLYQLPLLMGVPLLLAIASFGTTGWSLERRFLATWAGVSLLLIYLPVVYQIKLLAGWQFPLALLASDSWHDAVVPALQRVSRRPVRTATMLACLMLVIGTNVYLFAWRFVDLRRHDAPYYLHRDEVDALSWLAVHTSPTDLVLAREDVGRFVPNYGRARSFLAHWAMTNRYFERRDLVTRFFDSAAADTAWRTAVLTENQITFVVDTGSADASVLHGSGGAFELAFSRPKARIYRVGATGTLARPHGRQP
ncbi:MAG: hypothetical protein ABMA15_04050 [Vicinamibacterales bacterium]